VIFKACMIDGRPTLKASNSLDKTTLPGSMQVFVALMPPAGTSRT